MPSIQDSQLGFPSARQPQPWMHHDTNSPRLDFGPRRPSSSVQFDAPRPMEPAANSQNASKLYLPARNPDSGPPRQQLPGLHELLSPPVRTGASTSPLTFPSNWPSIKPTWTEGPAQSAKADIPPSNTTNSIGPKAYNPTPPPFHRLSLDGTAVDRFNQQPPPPPPPPPPVLPAAARPSLPAPPPGPSTASFQSSRGLSDFRVARSSDQLYPLPISNDSAGAAQPLARTSLTDEPPNRAFDRRMSMVHDEQQIVPPASNYSLQCVGQRHIPGEGLCYVFKDGSTCPTVIDGEPVNPLWGTTKAGKARKRLAQACLNCREKKIKCEPGEKSCLQCEKAKRECHSRPQVPQLQAELANSASLAVPNPPLGRADWSSQSSGSVVMTDMPTQKRRRSAQAAQQDVLNLPPSWSRGRSPQSVKRRRSDVSASSTDEAASQRQRKDSKRVDPEDVVSTQPQTSKADPTSWNEDPYQIDPEATILFLELFFAQFAREVSILFPRGAFTRWVRHCREKCQRECMVLYAVLSLGSIFAENEFASFAKLCSERASQAVSRIDGKFSMALAQARMLMAAYYHITGKESMGWDLSGSAFRILSAMRLNTEDGCGQELDEYARRYYSFTREQLRECRRRTFWTAFLMDRYHGFCGGFLCAIQNEDIRLRLPCTNQNYEEGLASDAPFFDSSQPNMGARSSDGSPSALGPAAYLIGVAALWTDVIKLIFRRPHQVSGPGMYTRSHESSADNIQTRLLDWKNSLPRHLQYNRHNLVDAIHLGYAGSLISMHALYHISQLKAARNVNHELLAQHAVSRNIRAAHSHAYQLLEMVFDIRNTQPNIPDPRYSPVNLLSPFFAYGITAAIDTLSAGGFREDLGRLRMILMGSITILHDLGQYCVSAKTQAKQASRRMDQIEARATECFESRVTATGQVATINRDTEEYWKIAEPMEKQFDLQQDVSYGTALSVYLSALR